jgi:hypothetical protein
LNRKQAYTFQQQIHKLKMTGNEDGQDILSHLSSAKQRKLIKPVIIPLSFNPKPHLDQIADFKIRFLVEGLISQAIVIPSELPELMTALTRSTSDVNLRERILGALFNEERVKNVTRLVEGNLCRWRCLTASSSQTASKETWKHRQAYGDGLPLCCHPNPRYALPSRAGDFQRCHSKACTAYRPIPPSSIYGRRLCYGEYSR